MPELNFRTNAKIEQLIGRELITNNSIAIFELIKNSYDANANLVEIKFKNLEPFIHEKNHVITNSSTILEICDDGEGMTLKDIEEKWMEIGTPAKEKKNITNSQIQNFTNRFLNGEKGIGRFSIDKIGSILSMETKHKNDQQIKLDVNWDDFNDHSKQIEDIKCSYKYLGNSVKSGTKLTISNLRDSWTEKDIKELISSLKKFLTPIENETDNFKIKFSYHTINNENENFYIKNDTFDYLDSYIDAYLSTDKKLSISIYDNSEVVDTLKIKDFHLSSFGAVNIRIFYLDTNSKRFFTKRMGLRTSDYGNIKVFRDNFRVMPYGEPENDWLQIDNKHAQGVYRTFGTKDLIGYVLLSNDPSHKNYILKEATDRLGFIEDSKEFGDLKNFLWIIIDKLQEYFFEKLRLKSKETAVVLKETSRYIDSEIKNNKNVINNIIDQYISNDQDRSEAKSLIEKNSEEINRNIKQLQLAAKEVQNQIKIYDKITGKENFLFDILHQIRNKLAIINAKLTELEFEISFNKFDFSLEPVFGAYDSIDHLVNSAIDNVNLSKLRKEKINLTEYLFKYDKKNKELFKKEKVNFKMKSKITNPEISFNRKALDNVIENLTSNSLKALKNCDNKKIGISISTKGDRIQVLFEDNGVGIKDENKPFIFSLWSSFSDRTGSGIGLYSVKTTLEDAKSEINLVNIGNSDMKTSFQLLFPSN